MINISHIRQRDILVYIVGVISGLILFWGVNSNQNSPIYNANGESNLKGSSNLLPDSSGIAIPMDPFPEEPWRTPSTLAVRVGNNPCGKMHTKWR